MKPVVDYVHSRGLKFGLYTSVGTLTCKGDPGSYGHYRQDAQTFASWGVDYVKMDWCGQDRTSNGHKEFSYQLNQTGRPIVLELCRGDYQTENKWGYAPQVAQLFRATGDHHDDWGSTVYEVASVKGKGDWSKSYGWAYLDMLMTGGQGCPGQKNNQALHCPGQTDDEYRTEFTLWSVIGSPLLIGTDIRNMTSIMNELILNPEALAVNQDVSDSGDFVEVCSSKFGIWVRKLSTGQIAVAAPNLGKTSQNIQICFEDLGIAGNTKVTIRDLWRRTDLGVFVHTYSRTIRSHDTMYLSLTVQ